MWLNVERKTHRVADTESGHCVILTVFTTITYCSIASQISSLFMKSDLYQHNKTEMYTGGSYNDKLNKLLVYFNERGPPHFSQTTTLNYAMSYSDFNEHLPLDKKKEEKHLKWEHSKNQCDIINVSNLCYWLQFIGGNCSIRTTLV